MPPKYSRVLSPELTILSINRHNNIKELLIHRIVSQLGLILGFLDLEWDKIHKKALVLTFKFIKPIHVSLSVSIIALSPEKNHIAELQSSTKHPRFIKFLSKYSLLESLDNKSHIINNKFKHSVIIYSQFISKFNNQYIKRTNKSVFLKEETFR